MMCLRKERFRFDLFCFFFFFFKKKFNSCSFIFTYVFSCLPFCWPIMVMGEIVELRKLLKAIRQYIVSFLYLFLGDLCKQHCY